MTSAAPAPTLCTFAALVAHLPTTLRRLLLVAIALVAVICAYPMPSAHAASRQWTGSGADNEWTTTTNWLGGASSS